MEVGYGNKAIDEYILDILTLGVCKLFLPVGFINKNCDQRLIGNYHLQGYRQLSFVEEISTEDALSIIIFLLQGMEDAEYHYIFFDEYEINGETIFLDRYTMFIKMIYIPSSEERTGPEKLLELLEYLKEKCCREGQAYIDSGIEYIKNENFRYPQVINYFESLKKEVYLCDIK